MLLLRKYLWLNFLFFSLFTASSIVAEEFRLRAHHAFWKNQTADTEKEIDFGRGVSAKILGKYPILRDERSVNYITRIGTGISAQLGRPELRYYFGVLDTEEINAFAAPGGYIFVTRGALKLMHNEAQLAGVLAHELAHIDQKHIVRKLKLQSIDRSLTSGIAQVLGGASLSAKIALERLNDLAFKMLMEEGLSKDDEADADQKALEMLLSTGYDLQSYLDYLQSLKPFLEKGQAKVLSKTHPTIQFRYNNLRNFIIKNELENFNGKKNEKRFQQNTVQL
ncbi:MAG: M48 family metalloprotease [SAR324 cluster bacterium]|nr:M48 family metalloprotease [SAR324 cluster bacterium]MBL7035182.1 M48 family metalloprotease [SAR324 cluster bacterium]